MTCRGENLNCRPGYTRPQARHRQHLWFTIVPLPALEGQERNIRKRPDTHS